jgi:nucleoside-diphosphate-sugar epimerase
LFSVYGKWEDSTRLYPSIVEALEKGERPKLSRPQSVRDFIPVERVVEWYEQIVRLPFKAGEIINIGSGKQQTIEQFYNRIARQMNKEHIRPIWGAALPRDHEPKVWQADVTRLNELLGHLREEVEA